MSRSTSSLNRTETARLTRALSGLGLALLITACGGSDGRSTPAEQSASDTSTEVLQRNAADNAGKAITTNVDTMLRSLGGSAALGSALNVPGLGLFLTPDNQKLADDADEDRLFDDELGTDLDTGIAGVMRTTLGLEGSAQSSRVGDRITIDPDERRVCEQELIGDATDSAELQRCVDLLSDLTVQIDATSDQRGVITYLFQSHTLLTISYAPDFGSYELDLVGAKAVMQRQAELDDEADPVPETMQGAVRISATVLDDTQGQEAINFTLSITEALSIVHSSEDTDLSIEPSTLFSATADTGAGTASFEVAIGALQISSTDTDDAGGTFINTLAMAGLSLRADLLSDGDVLTVTNLGIGNGPLTVAVNSTEVVRITLETLGFSVDDSSQRITLSNDLNLGIALSNVMHYLDPETSDRSTATYTVTAPAGTVMTEQTNDALQVVSGGPFQFFYDLFDGTNTATGTVTVNAGSCLASDDNPEADSPLRNTNCNP